MGKEDFDLMDRLVARDLTKLINEGLAKEQAKTSEVLTSKTCFTTESIINTMKEMNEELSKLLEKMKNAVKDNDEREKTKSIQRLAMEYTESIATTIGVNVRELTAITIAFMDGASAQRNIDKNKFN